MYIFHKNIKTISNFSIIQNNNSEFFNNFKANLPILPDPQSMWQTYRPRILPQDLSPAVQRPRPPLQE